jgi:hypothetical protein
MPISPNTPPPAPVVAEAEAMLAAALAAAERGWPVIPLRPGAKVPALHGWDRCPHTGACADRHQGWEQRATTDPTRIRTAWASRGGRDPFNVGIACGPSGLVVLDLDTAKPGDQPPARLAELGGVHDGQDVLAVLAEQAGQPVPADTYTVATASGGLHLYYTAPAGTPLRNTAGERGRGLGWKIDTRAHGGQVVAAGSVVAGRPYRVVVDVDPAQLPGWLAQRLTPTPPPLAPSGPIALATDGAAGRDRYVSAAVQGETAKVRAAPPDQRNATLYTASVALGQLVAGGALAEVDARAALLAAAGVHIAARAYSEREAHKTIASGIRAGANRPRQVAA